jgi:site-specific recombinase XerD
MQQLLDFRLSFICRTGHLNAKGKNPIILRVTYNGDRRDIFTGLYCFKKNWNGGEGRVLNTEKDAASINQNLELILRRANNAFDELRFSGDSFSTSQLVEKLKGKGPKPALLIDVLADGIKQIKKRVGVEITKSSYYKYRRSLKYMQEYLEAEYKVKNYTLNRIDLKFLEAFFHFLRTEKAISHNTALKYVTLVKSVLQPSIRSGIIIGDPFRELRIKPKPVHRNYLTQEELNILINLKLNDPDLERKRDIFLFSCFTGLAYVDLKNLRGENVILDNDGEWYIKTNRQKTGEQSIIPLLPAARNILVKYSLTDNIQDFTWLISSNQKMNKGLKSIGKRAKISKVLHMHLARHTFATTVTLSNGVPIESVSKMLGHTNIRQTQHYAKVVATKIKMDMAKIKDLYQ